MEDATPVYAHHNRHWHYVRRHRARRKNHTSREMLIGQLISVAGSILAGYLLELNKTQFLAVTGSFLILPGIIDLGGSIAGAMGARINHRLQGGGTPRDVLVQSFNHAFLLSLVAAFFLGLFGAGLGALLFKADFIKLFFIGGLSALVAGAIGYPLVAAATYLAFRKGTDADNFIGPVETSIFDSLTILTLALVIRIFT